MPSAPAGKREFHRQNCVRNLNQDGKGREASQLPIVNGVKIKLMIIGFEKWENWKMSLSVRTQWIYY